MITLEDKQTEQLKTFKNLLSFVSDAIVEYEDVVSGRIGDFQAYKLAALDTVASNWQCPTPCEQVAYVLSLENKDHWSHIYDKLVSAERNITNYIAV